MIRWISIMVLLSALIGCAGRTGYEVARIVDGDTLIVRMNDKNECIRLRSLNAPEMDEPGGPEAKTTLEKQFPVGSKVYLEIFARDKYGRIVAEVRERRE